MENTETLVWLDFSYVFRYISLEQFEYHQSLNEEVGKLIGHAISNPDRY